MAVPRLVAVVNRERRQTIAQVVLVIAVVAGLIRLENVIDRVELEAKRRDFETCESANEARGGILHFIESFVDEPYSPREQQFLDRARRTFDQKECPPDPDGERTHES